MPKSAAAPKPPRPAAAAAAAAAKKHDTFPCTRRNDKGPAIGYATCAEGCSKKAKPVRSCTLHGKCVVAVTTEEGFQCCRDCSDRIDPATVPPAPPPDIAPALAESQTDKHRVHGYGPMYAELTAGRRIRSVLELGVLAGDSIRVWAAVWPDAEIVAADIDQVAAERIRDVPAQFVRLDVADTAALIAFGRDNRNRFDLIIDDSTHAAAHQLAIRRHLRQAIRPGGVMIVEDVAGDATCDSLRGRVWDFRSVGRWDSRAVSIERPVRPRALFSGNYLQRDGAPILFANLARFLRGWDITVHSPHDGPLREVIEGAGIPVILGPLDVDHVTDADLVVANTILAHEAVRRAKEHAIPCVWLIHESDPAMCGPAVAAAVRGLIDYPARVVFPCKATAEAYRDLPEHRGAIIPTVIPPVPIRERGAWHGFHIVTFGRDEPRKGRKDIREAVYGLEGVTWEAVHDRPDPSHSLAAADLYVCSSRVEAFPLSLQEAKAYGLPVITTPVFGAADIIRNGLDGLHYQPGDVQDLREKIEAIRTDAELRARLSRPLTHLPHYEDTLRQYEALFAAAAGVKLT